MAGVRVSRVALVAARSTPKVRVSRVAFRAAKPAGAIRVSRVRLRVAASTGKAVRVSQVKLQTGRRFPCQVWSHDLSKLVPILEFRVWDFDTGSWAGVLPTEHVDPPPPPPPALPRRVASGLGARSRDRVNTAVQALLTAGIKGHVFLEANWRDIQPTDGDTISSTWLSSIRADLDWAQGLGLVAPIRLFAGYQAPDWLAAAVGGGMPWYSSENGTGATAPSNPAWRLLSRTLVPHWHTTVRGASRNAVRLLAAAAFADGTLLVDHPALAGFTISWMSSQYAEPAIQQFALAENRAAALAAGYTKEAQLAAWTDAFAAHRDYLSPTGTASYLSFNYLQTIGASGGMQEDIPNTIWLMDRFVADLGPMAVIENNSFQHPQTKYPGMYPHMWELAAGGQLLHLQTETGAKTEAAWDVQARGAKISTPQNQAEAAFGYGASSMELFAGAEAASVVDAADHTANPATTVTGETRWSGITPSQAVRYNGLGWNNGVGKDARRVTPVEIAPTLRSTRGVLSWGTPVGKTRAFLEAPILKSWCAGAATFLRPSHIIGNDGLGTPDWSLIDLMRDICEDNGKAWTLSVIHGNAAVGWPTSWQAALNSDEIITLAADDVFPAFHSAKATQQFRDFVAMVRDRYAASNALVRVRMCLPVWGSNAEPWFQGGSTGRALHLSAWNAYVTRTGVGTTGDAAMLDAYDVAWRSQLDWFMAQWPDYLKVAFSAGDGFGDIASGAETSPGRHPRQYAAYTSAHTAYGDRLVIGYDGIEADGTGFGTDYVSWIRGVFRDGLPADRMEVYLQPYTGRLNGPEPRMTLSEAIATQGFAQTMATTYEGYQSDTCAADADDQFAADDPSTWVPAP